MKLKAFVALSIALLMLFTMVAPALAGPNRFPLGAVSGTGEAGTGTATVRTTHDNQCKVTIVLEGATPLRSYQVYVYDGTVYHWAGTLATDAAGNERFSGTPNETFPSGVLNCQVTLKRTDLGDQVAYVTTWFDLNFR